MQSGVNTGLSAAYFRATDRDQILPSFGQPTTHSNGRIFYDAPQFRAVLKSGLAGRTSLSKGMIAIEQGIVGEQLRLREACIKAPWENASENVPFSLDIVEGCERALGQGW